MRVKVNLNIEVEVEVDESDPDQAIWTAMDALAVEYDNDTVKVSFGNIDIYHFEWWNTGWTAIDTDEEDECNTCGDTNRWLSTTEDSPEELVDLGPCPDCKAT